jgi:UDP-glucose 4-epimerase
MKKILVTGGLGYIGSHTVVQLLQADFEVCIIDNLSNSKADVVNRIEKITGKRPEFLEGDVRDATFLRNVFHLHPIDAVIHFAGLKAVGQSQKEPLRYYDNNVSGSICLLETMRFAGIKNIVFSSSATVYGNPGISKFTENLATNPINVYGQTKLFVEKILQDLKKSDPSWRIALLRYFNPVGAHSSGLIGENPTGIPNNLMPFVAQVAVGKLKKLHVFGNDYPTLDGTGLRDYIHVEDLATGHLKALTKLMSSENLIKVNLGTGKAYSVLEMIKAFEEASGKTIPYEIVARRSGDLAEYYADPTLAKQLLDWVAKYDINRMCEDTWRWQENSSVANQNDNIPQLGK